MAAAGAVPDVKSLVAKHCADGALPLFGADKSDVAPEAFALEEIGDGNLNFVWRVSQNGSGKSVVVKYAPPYVKVLGPDYALTASRLAVEYRALQEFDARAPGLCPRPMCYDAAANAMVMEDLKGFKVLRDRLIAGHFDLNVSMHVGHFLAQLHMPKSCHATWEELNKEFANTDMVRITTDYIYTKPFTDDATNAFDESLRDGVETLLQDGGAMARVQELKEAFVGKHEVLCHGDLHSGSIMVDGSLTKVIDAEFAFIGPTAFDLGLYIAHLIFAYVRHEATRGAEAVDSIRKVWSSYADRRRQLDQPSASVSASRPEPDLAAVFTEAIGHAACDILRRVIGPAKVADIKGQPEKERRSLELGHKLLLASARTTTVDDVVALLNRRE